MTASYEWSKRRVWIIGASTGIGRAVALALAQRGAQIMLSARGKEALHALQGELAGDGHGTLPLDVTDAPALHQAAQAVEAQWGGVDHVLFAAGIYTPMQAMEFDLASASAIIDVNLKGALNAAHAALPLLRRGTSPQLALIASVAGYHGLPNGLAYGASKAGLINLAEAMHLDCRNLGIDVKLICPGFVRTPLTAPNRFPMPFIIEAEDAAERIIAGMESARFEIHFPRRLSLMLKLLRILPYRLSLPLVKKATGL